MFIYLFVYLCIALQRRGSPAVRRAGALAVAADADLADTGQYNII